MAPLLKDAKHTTSPYSSRFSRAKIELDGGVLSSSFLPLKHEVCFALSSFHESRGKDVFPDQEEQKGEISGRPGQHSSLSKKTKCDSGQKDPRTPNSFHFVHPV